MINNKNVIGAACILGIMLIIEIISPLNFELLFLIEALFILFYWKISSTPPVYLAIIGLILLPIILHFTYNEVFENGMMWAENIATGVLFFIFIGVLIQVFED